MKWLLLTVLVLVSCSAAQRNSIVLMHRCEDRCAEKDSVYYALCIKDDAQEAICTCKNLSFSIVRMEEQE
jgi:hypothetical protein